MDPLHVTTKLFCADHKGSTMRGPGVGVLLLLLASRAYCRRLSFESLKGYEPLSCIDSERAIGLDAQSMHEALINDSNILAAMQIYEQGENSGTAANLMWSAPLTNEVKKGAQVTGLAINGNTVEGTVAASVPVGATSMKVMYNIPSCSSSDGDDSTFSTGLQCLVGLTPITSGCFKEEFSIIVDGQEIPYTYSSTANNDMNTISTLWTDPQIYTSSSFYQQGIRYFGMENFLDAYIQAARTGTTFSVDNGPTYFTTFSSEERRVALSAALLWANHVAVVGKWEEAQGYCQARILGEAARAVDVATAWYVGAAHEHSLFEFANKACAVSGTCSQEMGNENIAEANLEILKTSKSLQLAASSGNCVQVRASVRRLTEVSLIPFIQTIKLLATQRGSDSLVLAEGDAFAQTLYSSFSLCDTNDARILYFFVNNLSTVSILTGALEKNYPCLGVTCKDIGGVNGVDPCLDDSTMGTSAPVPATPPPTRSPTLQPTTRPPTSPPTPFPSRAPVVATQNPTNAPTISPMSSPTYSPTASPTDRPTSTPTFGPTVAPTLTPSNKPTEAPAIVPTLLPTELEVVTQSPIASEPVTVSPVSPGVPTTSPRTITVFPTTMGGSRTPTQKPSAVPDSSRGNIAAAEGDSSFAFQLHASTVTTLGALLTALAWLC